MRILVVDDDVRLCSVVARGLTEEGYAVDTANDGGEGQYLAEINAYDLVILDVMMPKADGVTVCRNLREQNNESTILMLTAKDAIADRVNGLDAGADDYLVKPFAFDELVARVRALTRRSAPTRSTDLAVGDLVLNTVTRQLQVSDSAVELTTKEYAVLEYFMRNPGAVITRGMIEEHAWNNDFDSVSNLVDVYIRRLRSKIDQPGEQSSIETIRGAGYRMRAS